MDIESESYNTKKSTNDDRSGVGQVKPTFQKWSSRTIKNFVVAIAYNAPFQRYSLLKGKRRVAEFARFFTEAANESGQLIPHMSAITSRFYSVIPNTQHIAQFYEENRGKISQKSSIYLSDEIKKNDHNQSFANLKKRCPESHDDRIITGPLTKMVKKEVTDLNSETKFFRDQRKLPISQPEPSKRSREDLYVKVDATNAKIDHYSQYDFIIRLRINEETATLREIINNKEELMFNFSNCDKFSIELALKDEVITKQILYSDIKNRSVQNSFKLKFDLLGFKNDFLQGSIFFELKIQNFDPQEELLDISNRSSFDDNDSTVLSNMPKSSEESGTRTNERKLCLKILMLNNNILPHPEYTEDFDKYKLKIPNKEEDEIIIKKLLDLFFPEFYRMFRDELLEKTKKFLNDRDTLTHLIDPYTTSNFELWAINRSLYQQILDLKVYMKSQVELKNSIKTNQIGKSQEDCQQQIDQINNVTIEMTAIYDKIVFLMQVSSNAQLLKHHLEKTKSENIEQHQISSAETPQTDFTEGVDQDNQNEDDYAEDNQEDYFNEIFNNDGGLSSDCNDNYSYQGWLQNDYLLYDMENLCNDSNQSVFDNAFIETRIAESGQTQIHDSTSTCEYMIGSEVDQFFDMKEDVTNENNDVFGFQNSDIESF